MEKNRLLWASRRGMLELDLVLNPFTQNFYDGLELEDKERYHQLLDQEDQDLFAWFLGRQQPDNEDLQRIVGIILDVIKQ